MTEERTRQARRNAIALVRARIEGDAETEATLLLPDPNNPDAVVDMVNALLDFSGELVQLLAGDNWRSVLDKKALRAADDRYNEN